jgi:hypothetical protein
MGEKGLGLGFRLVGVSAGLVSVLFGSAALVAPAAVASPAVAGTNWTQQAVPDGQIPGGSLAAVSCTPVRCVAVGQFDTPKGDVAPLVEANSGTGWSVHGVPTWGHDAGLTAVSCSSAGSCTAVGWYTDAAGATRPFAEQLSDSTWRVTPVPGPAGASLAGVSCVSSTSCQAVGSVTSSTGSQRPFASSWDGRNWSTVGFGTHVAGVLLAVSCASSAVCEAGGSQSSGSALAAGLVGGSWAAQAVPISSGGNAAVNGLSCPSAVWCVGVGNDGGKALAVIWDGTAWASSGARSPGEQPVLSSVACITVGRCEAVGSARGLTNAAVTPAGGHSERPNLSPTPFSPPPPRQLPLAEGLSAGTWTVQHTDDTHPGDTLVGVSCSAALDCLAVGGSAVPLSERYTGKWASVVPIAPLGAALTSLQSVSCPTPSFCAAVGFSQGPINEIRSGAHWADFTPPTTGLDGGTLEAVSCTSPTFCAAVGEGPDLTPLTEIWNGLVWTVVPLTPPPGTVTTAITGVSCSTPTACTAVGYYAASPTYESRAFAAAWDGTGWTVTDGANPPGAVQTLFQAVSCSAGACTAVGFWDDSTFQPQTLAERSVAGGPWTLEPMPSQAGPSLLFGVSCTGASSCQAVGWSELPSTTSLIEGWDGTTWSDQTLPAITGPSNLLGISCATSTSCTAVGEGGQGSLALRLSGGSWQLDGPQPGPWNFLNGISCSASGGCTAVGSYNLPEGFYGALALQQY